MRVVGTCWAAALVVALAAGCGSSSRTTSTPPKSTAPTTTSAANSSSAPAISRSEYRTAVDKLCTAANLDRKRVEREVNDAIKNNDYGRIASAFRKYVPDYRANTKALRGVAGSRDDLERAEVLFTLYDRIAAGYDDIADAAAADDTAAFAAAGDRTRNLLKQRTAAAQAFGFKVCGKP